MTYEEALVAFAQGKEIEYCPYQSPDGVDIWTYWQPNFTEPAYIEWKMKRKHPVLFRIAISTRVEGLDAGS